MTKKKQKEKWKKIKKKKTERNERRKKTKKKVGKKKRKRQTEKIKSFDTKIVSIVKSDFPFRSLINVLHWFSITNPLWIEASIRIYRSIPPYRPLSLAHQENRVVRSFVFEVEHFWRFPFPLSLPASIFLFFFFFSNLRSWIRPNEFVDRVRGDSLARARSLIASLANRINWLDARDGKGVFEFLIMHG